MPSRRNHWSHTFIFVTVLLSGHSSHIFAQEKLDEVAVSQSIVASAETSTNTPVTPKSTGNETTASQLVTAALTPVTNATAASTSLTNATAASTSATNATVTPSPETNTTEPVTTQPDTTEPTTVTIPATPPQGPPTVLSIFVVNDMQYDIFPVHSENGSLCIADEAEKCIGGLASLKSFMDAERNSSIWLNSGNTLGGDLFRTLKFETAIKTSQLLNFNALAVGPNIFKYGGDAGQDFLNELKQTVVVSNIDPAPVKKSKTFLVGNCNVSVIGFLDNSELDNVRGVSVKNYTESILEEVNRTRNEQKNISNLITVVIGSSTVDKAKVIASIEGIDFVFFSGEEVKGEQNTSQYYWETVNKSSNKTAYVGSLKVNHSSTVGRFIIGQMQLPIEDSCRVANANFSVIDYSNSNTSDKAALELIKSELAKLESLNKSLTENTKNLTEERDLCNCSECSLGNLITDAMVAALRSDSTWSANASRIGVFPGAHLQANRTIPLGDVTAMNLYGLIDQDVFIYSVILTGQQLKDLLEVSINSMANSNPTDFLHMSGLLRVEYKQEPENNSRIASIKTVSAASASMKLSDVDVNDKETFYNVSIPLNLLEMDNYKELLGTLNISYHPVTIVEAVTSYINSTGFLPLPVLGTRLIMLETHTPPPPPVQCESHTGTTIIVTLVVAALIIGLAFGLYRWRSIRSHLIPGYINF